MRVQVLPGIWKADIKAAFRRVPLKAEHTWAAAVAFKAAGKVHGSSQPYAFEGLSLLCVAGLDLHPPRLPVWRKLLSALMGTVRAASGNPREESVTVASAALR